MQHRFSSLIRLHHARLLAKVNYFRLLTGVLWNIRFLLITQKEPYSYYLTCLTPNACLGLLSKICNDSRISQESRTSALISYLDQEPCIFLEQKKLQGLEKRQELKGSCPSLVTFPGVAKNVEPDHNMYFVSELLL